MIRINIELHCDITKDCTCSLTGKSLDSRPHWLTAWAPVAPWDAAWNCFMFHILPMQLSHKKLVLRTAPSTSYPSLVSRPLPPPTPRRGLAWYPLFVPEDEAIATHATPSFPGHSQIFLHGYKMKSGHGLEMRLPVKPEKCWRWD